jgi:hypothetical protein
MFYLYFTAIMVISHVFNYNDLDTTERNEAALYCFRILWKDH